MARVWWIEYSVWTPPPIVARLCLGPLMLPLKYTLTTVQWSVWRFLLLYLLLICVYYSLLLHSINIYHGLLLPAYCNNAIIWIRVSRTIQTVRDLGPQIQPKRSIVLGSPVGLWKGLKRRLRELLKAKGYIWPYTPSQVLIRTVYHLNNQYAQGSIINIISICSVYSLGSVLWNIPLTRR